MVEKKIMVDRCVAAETLMIEEALQVERYRFEKEDEAQTNVIERKDTLCQTDYIVRTEAKEIQTEDECLVGVERILRRRTVRRTPLLKN